MKRTSGMIFTLVLVLSLVLIMAGPMATPVQATEKVSGPESGGDADNDDSIGTQSWASLSKVSEQDNDSAVALLWVGHNTSYYLKVTDFGFDIPDTAEIEGIEVQVDRWADAGTDIVRDNSICLVQGGNITGADRSAGAAWPDSESDLYVSYGNLTDNWELGWQPADINNEGFGAAISAVFDGSGAGNAWVDHVQITVYYSVDEYWLTMEVSPYVQYGTVHDDTMDPPYLENEVIDISATPNTGYEFAGWTAKETSGGPETTDGFGNAELAVTTFTMPAYNVTVIATFQLPGPLDPPTVTTERASSIGCDAAYLNMNYTRNDWQQVRLRFAYREDGMIPWQYTDWVVRAQDGDFHESVSDLSKDTTYEFQAQLKYDTFTIDTADILQFTTDEECICFIATAAYGTPAAEEIDVLREFRDSVLLESTAGSLFVSLYYQLGPPVADFIAGNELLRTLVRELLIDPIVCVVDATGNIWRN